MKSNFAGSRVGVLAGAIIIVILPLPSSAQTSFKTLNYLYSISGSKTIAGQMGDGYMQPMKDVSGRYPALWGEDWSFDMISTM